MKIAQGRLVEARFTDPSFTLIRACFKDYSKDNEFEAFHVEMYSYDPDNPSKEVRQILEEFPQYELEKNYYNFNKSEEWKWRMYNTFIEHSEEIIPYIESGITPQVVEQKPVTLESITELSNNAEDFFKLKLEIFELPEVKSSKDRKWKASMRKASTTLELLSLLYQVYSTTDDESSESAD